MPISINNTQLEMTSKMIWLSENASKFNLL